MPGGTAGKKRSHEGSDEEGGGETSKKRRVEDETLEEAVAEIVAVIEDTKKMVGPQSMFPEHAPRSEIPFPVGAQIR